MNKSIGFLSGPKCSHYVPNVSKTNGLNPKLAATTYGTQFSIVMAIRYFHHNVLSLQIVLNMTNKRLKRKYIQLTYDMEQIKGKKKLNLEKLEPENGSW